MRSKECEFIDELIMACNTQDADMLDKARMHPQVNYFDFEVKKLIKEISLFGFEDTSSAPLPVENNLKSNLFATKPKKAPEVVPPPPAQPQLQPPPPSASAFIPPPPPPPAPKVNADEEDVNETQGLDDLQIDDEHADANVEEVDPFTDAYEPEPPKASQAGPVVLEEEDDDEIDLS
jgi:hypothetical protein